MHIIIFRHGEKQSREEAIDPEINRSVCMSEKGIAQITRLAEELAINFPDFVGEKVIYSSPFPRTIQAAEIVRHILQIKEVRPNILFKEFYAFNDYAIPQERQKAMHQFALEHLSYVTESGYSYGERVSQILTFFVSQYQTGAERILISGHGGFIRSMLLTIDQEQAQSYLTTKMPEAGFIECFYNGNEFTLHET